MLGPIIPLLSGMSYQELKDFIDYCEFHHLSKILLERDRAFFKKSVRKRRAGQKTGGLPYYEDKEEKDNKHLLSPYTEVMLKAEKLVSELSNENLTLLFGMPEIIRHHHDKAIAWALLKEKSPIRHKSKTKKSPEQEVYTSKGNIQVKWIKYKRIVKDANGDPIVQEVKSPYLYLRYWTVRGAGESGRGKSLFKSKYIGGQTEGIEGRKRGGYPYSALAHFFWQLLEESRQSEKGKRTPDSPLYMLERQIMACIDMSQDEPIIDHECLKALQDEILGDEQE